MHRHPTCINPGILITLGAVLVIFASGSARAATQIIDSGGGRTGGILGSSLDIAADGVEKGNVAGSSDGSAVRIGTDCNSNGVPDATDIADGTSPDVNGNGVPDECDACVTSTECADDSVCTFDTCGQSGCTHESARYGDVAGSPGTCGPDGDVSLVDILAVLDGFQNVFADGCGPSNIDMASQAGACLGDGAIDLSDVLAVLDAFQGTTSCCTAQR